MQLNRRVFSAIALTAALALGACGGNSDPAGAGQSSYERGSDRGIGNADAPVTMIEYASVACGHCASFHEEVWPTINANYVETGQVRYVFREMITGSPQFAIAGFALAHCVAPERYFDMLDVLFQQQRAIFQAASQPGGARGQYLAIARSMGMSEADFDACLNNQDVNAEIVAAHDRALADGIDSTPRFLFNGELLEARRAPGATEYTYFLGNSQVIIDGEPVPGIVDADTFSRLIDHLLARRDADAGASGSED
ncbi:thioredoxin domain-containing protein [Maricaulis sp.]|uniref:thioredoxin domain-containing protein n=1 Tax=Maricaulis sp. TaxID=1486257 RepID=UPI003A9466BE